MTKVISKTGKFLINLVSLLSAIILIALTFTVNQAYAYSGEDYDPSKGDLASTMLPRYYSGPSWGSNSVSYTLYTMIDSGSTDNCANMGHMHPHYYSGEVKLWVNPDTSNERCINSTTYVVSAKGSAGSGSINKTSSGSLSYGDLSSYADMRVVSTPSVYSSGCSTSYGTPRVFASATGGQKQGSVELELCVYVEDWSGPGDNDVPPYLEPSMRFATDDRYKTVTVSSTDPISYYYYTYDDSSYNYTVSYGSYGSGSSFSQSVDLSNAGKYCHVTFYTQSGASCSTVIKVPDAVNLTYNLNGGTGTTPSSQKAWAGQSVRIASNSSTRTNCEFLGWSTTKYDVLEYGKTVSNLLSPGTAYTLNSNTTLYAVWRTVKVPYTINFTLNGNKPAQNDFAYITGYVNGGTQVTQSREFSYLEIPGYTVSAKIKSSDENVFLMVGDNKSPGYEYTIPTKTINTGTTDTVNCGTIHPVAYDANGGTYGKDAAGNDIPGPEDMTKYYGTSIVVSSNTPTRIGYNFTQWKVTYKVVGSLNYIVSENFTDGNGDGHLTTEDAKLIAKCLNAP